MIAFAGRGYVFPAPKGDASVIHARRHCSHARRFIAGASFLALTAAFCAAPADAKALRKRAPATAVNTQPLWTDKPKGAVILVVSIADQRLTIYDDGEPVAHSTISTGVDGHLTPRGVFTVIQKDRYHRSNIYSNAPMPYMERITWSGVALHEGHVTGHPASHGCIRLPHDVAAKLWTYLKLGARVIVANTDVAPRDFSHPNLFAAVKRVLAAAKPVAPAQVAENDAANITDARDAPATPGPVSPALDATQELAVPAPEPAAEPVIAVAPPDEPIAPGDAPTEASTPVAVAPAPAPVEPTPAEPAPVVPAPAAALTIPPGPGHVSIFISKREGKLFVRRNFLPIFETPVTISEPEKPLGSHLYTAMDVKDDGANIRWTVVDLLDPPPPPPVRRLRKGETPPPPVVPPEPSSAADALDRVTIPAEARLAVAELVATGTSLIISDQGLGRETSAKGSDFIVLTR